MATKTTKKDMAKVSTKKKISIKSEITNGFEIGDYVVYPTHGVGQITGIEEQEIVGENLKLFIVEFHKEKMTLRVPIDKAEATGMRALSSADRMKTAMTTLKGRARVKRTMWSRRAQEYEAKINSGNPVSIRHTSCRRQFHGPGHSPSQHLAHPPLPCTTSTGSFGRNRPGSSNRCSVRRSAHEGVRPVREKRRPQVGCELIRPYRLPDGMGLGRR